MIYTNYLYQPKVKIQRIKSKKRRKKSEQKTNWFLYVLELENGKWYVGITRNIQKRINSHCIGTGANWTRVHPPISVVELHDIGDITQSAATKIENEMVRIVMDCNGKENVRGGDLCGLDLKW